jgi:hypothetical protein
MNDLGSSAALFFASLSTPCTHCGSRFLERVDLPMQKRVEITARDPALSGDWWFGIWGRVASRIGSVRQLFDRSGSRADGDKRIVEHRAAK